MSMQYKITQAYGRGSESVIAHTVHKQDALFLIDAKVQQDRALKTQVMYFLYELGEKIGEWSSTEVAASSDASGAQQSSSNAFRPSPYATVPRPGGMPASSFQESRDRDKNGENG